MTTRVVSVAAWMAFAVVAALVLWYVALSAPRLFSFAAIVAVIAYVGWSIAERTAAELGDEEPPPTILPPMRAPRGQRNNYGVIY